jgi:hypothetical protein
LLIYLLKGGEPGAVTIIAMMVGWLAAVGGTGLAAVHRLPEVVIQTQQYGLRVLADRPDPEAVVHFLRRIGYREIRAPASGQRPRLS